MATKNLSHHTSGGGNYYIRVFALSGADAGKVLDFSDDTFKSLASATTPYLAATERADMGGFGQSAYTIGLDLAKLNPLAVEKEFVVHWYEGSSPADAAPAQAIGEPFVVALAKEGRREWIVQQEINVKSTEGLASQLHVWLEHGGELVDIDGVEATPTMSTSVRMHGAGSALFVVTGDVGDVTDDIFEVEQELPGFTDDRLYAIVASITVNGVTYSSTHVRGCIG